MVEPWHQHAATRTERGISFTHRPTCCSTGGQSCPAACSPRRSGTDLDSDASGVRDLSLPVGFTWDLQQLPSESLGQEADRGDAEIDGPQPRVPNLNFKNMMPGRLSDVWSAVSHDFDTNQTTITVPPSIAGTAVGHKLVLRLLHNEWAFHLRTDIGAEWSVPVPVDKINKIARKMGKKNQPDRRCLVCLTETTHKCSKCHEVYYCGEACQAQHWSRHRRHCKIPVPAIGENVCIGVPDFACFWQYQKALMEHGNSDINVGIMVMSQANFNETFGSRMLLRTIISLAVHGKPAILPLKSFG